MRLFNIVEQKLKVDFTSLVSFSCFALGKRLFSCATMPSALSGPLLASVDLNAVLTGDPGWRFSTPPSSGMRSCCSPANWKERKVERVKDIQVSTVEYKRWLTELDLYCEVAWYSPVGLDLGLAGRAILEQARVIFLSQFNTKRFTTLQNKSSKELADSFSTATPTKTKTLSSWENLNECARVFCLL